VSNALPEIVRLNSVSRLYGTFAALRQVSINFEQGRCYVLLGENGAGKSTLLRTIAGLLRPTFGEVAVFGGQPHEHRDRIGYMGHAPMLYDELTGIENLRYFASLYRGRPGLSPEEAMSTTGLDPALTRPISQYSQGMRQRASLARALLSQPELLLLDEPFSNLDAASGLQMLSLLAGLRARGRTIILTTHQRDLAAPLADAFVTMHAGSVAGLENTVRQGSE
jgi:heme ABC exporter ATP-binding subunit CcmA